MNPLCLTLALALSACTYARYPNGSLAVASSANFRSLHLKTPQMELHIERHDPAMVIQKAGAAVSQGIMSAGGTAVGGGLVR